MELFNRTVIEISIISALLSLFLEFCLREGNVLGWWIDFLIDIELPSPISRDEKLRRSDKEDMLFSWWYKPLGGCVVCFNVWISFSLCLFLYNDVRMILVILLSSFLVRLFHEKIL